MIRGLPLPKHKMAVEVGKLSKNSIPITREAKAIEDIMNSPDYNGAPIYFMPYNSGIGPIIYEP